MIKQKTIPQRAAWLLLALLIIPLVIWMAQVLPPAVDWSRTFRPAALEMLAFRSPYNIGGPAGFFNPPWMLIPLLPFALLPEAWGRALLLLVALAAYAYSALRLGARRAGLFAFLLSPVVIHSLLNGSTEWMVLLGFVLPPQIGLFFVSVKPQVGAAVIIFWLVETWRDGGWKAAFRVFWPFTLASLLSLLVFGLYPLSSSGVVSYWWNASLFPASLPVGLVLLAASLVRRRKTYALAASPCLSPYVLFHSWTAALVALAGNELEMVIASLGLWVVVALRAFG